MSDPRNQSINEKSKSLFYFSLMQVLIADATQK